MMVSLSSFSQGSITKFLHESVEYGNGQFGAFNTFDMLMEKPREVIVTNDVLIPFHITHVGL